MLKTPRPSAALIWRALLLSALYAIVLIAGGLWVATAGNDWRARLAALIVLAVIATSAVLIWAHIRLSARLKSHTDVLLDLTGGHYARRASTKPNDEIGVLGTTLNAYADYSLEKHDDLRTQLRVKRQEQNNLLAVIESLPEGLVVQDLSGRVMVMNGTARRLLGAGRATADTDVLTGIVTDALGETLAPGLYALGGPLRVDIRDRVVQAQVSAVMTADIRVGTVILLRDLTPQARQDNARISLLDELQQQALSESAQVLLQKLRALGSWDDLTISHEDEVLPVETVIWAVANEWRQLLEDHKISFSIKIEQRGLHVRGDLRRLSWALGGIIDNALKYTPAGGQLVLQVQGSPDSMVTIRLRDTGVGIKPEELPQVFERFFRGTPETADGRALRVPGMGQGLTLAEQIVRQHGGQIEIKSKPQSGTAVYIHLPLAEPVTEQPEA